MKLSKVIYLIIIFLSFNCTSNKNKDDVNNNISIDKKDVFYKNKILKYVSAKSGLNFRDKPKGKILGKFNYGEKVEIIEKTGLIEEIKNGDKNITGEWLGIKNGDLVVYAFSGFLISEKQFKIHNSKFYVTLHNQKKNIEKIIRISPTSKIEYLKLNLNNGKLRENINIEFIDDDDNESPWGLNSTLLKKNLYRLGSKPFISPKGNYFVSGESGFVFSGIFDLFEIDINHNINIIVSCEFREWTKAEHLSEDDRKLSPNKHDIKWVNNKSFILPIFENNNYEAVKYLKIEIL